jgi:hypothetical protein
MCDTLLNPLPPISFEWPPFEIDNARDRVGKNKTFSKILGDKIYLNEK